MKPIDRTVRAQFNLDKDLASKTQRALEHRGTGAAKKVLEKTRKCNMASN